MRVYTLETKADRTVCLDGSFQCPNPACGYASPFRAWGRGVASDKVRGDSPTIRLPGATRMAVKRIAEQNAWGDAQRKYNQVTCPRCMRGPNEGIQFANPPHGPTFGVPPQ